ncbi:PPE family protein [Mycobacterium nebraskense]|uniref:PPE family protein n=3 Tax=Mycobacterium nebraskense TaxID=244292 RepID=A0A1X2A2H6_9MYCO|nr:PPE family protein [Mycobacterium nebraskense]MBI2696054.1 PPE family protein [Mycobacterium nebraskense]MCV7118111.1 PPE family protein [Mycobacterium nebraskense]ORW35655.1 hypothetical protein AWC17_21650 [Mycobacterium nebraskense]
MLFDFGALPPEINSTWMYTGPGPGPMMAAAAAWNSLAAELTTTASGYESVVSELTGGQWLGPSSAAMSVAAEPFIGWMISTAASAEHAASQAMASAAAYEAAFAMTVPPPVIAANRAQLGALVATNFLGINTPAIMANEAQYAQMWAQDAAAMYGYEGSSASAATLNPLISPTQTTNPAGPAARAAAVSPAAVRPVASPLAGSAQSTSSGLFSSSNGFLNDLVASGSNIGIWNDAYSVTGLLGSTGSSSMFQAIVGGVSHGVSQNAAAAAGAVAPGGGMGTVLAGTAGPAAGASGGGPVSAGMGSASSVGKLSVPAAWSAAAPAETGAATLTGSGWTGSAEEGTEMTTMATGMPAVASAGRTGYGIGPRYGVKPKVMPTQMLV